MTPSTKGYAIWEFRWYASLFRESNPNFGGMNRYFQAKWAKSKIMYIIEITAPIPTKFCTMIKTTKCSSRVVQTCAKQIQHDAWLPYWNKSSAISEMGDCLATIGMGQKWGGAAVGGWVPTGSPSNTMWPGLRPTTLPSGTLIHPTVWPQL